jgi:transaldolase
MAAAEAYLRGIERRIAAGMDPKIHSVASMFISRWDKAVLGKVPQELQDGLGIAIAKRTYKAYREMLASPRWKKAANAGAPTQRLLWASTGTKDPKASDVLYIKALAAPDTIDTIPENTLLAFADHGTLGGVLPEDGGDAESVIAAFGKAGLDDEKLAAELQREGAASFVASWKDLLNCIESKDAALTTAG